MDYPRRISRFNDLLVADLGSCQCLGTLEDVCYCNAVRLMSVYSLLGCASISNGNILSEFYLILEKQVQAREFDCYDTRSTSD
jgi:hypothetical protein